MNSSIADKDDTRSGLEGCGVHPSHIARRDRYRVNIIENRRADIMDAQATMIVNEGCCCWTESISKVNEDATSHLNALVSKLYACFRCESATTSRYLTSKRSVDEEGAMNSEKKHDDVVLCNKKLLCTTSIIDGWLSTSRNVACRGSSSQHKQQLFHAACTFGKKNQETVDYLSGQRKGYLLTGYQATR